MLCAGCDRLAPLAGWLAGWLGGWLAGWCVGQTMDDAALSRVSAAWEEVVERYGALRIGTLGAGAALALALVEDRVSVRAAAQMRGLLTLSLGAFTNTAHPLLPARHLQAQHVLSIPARTMTC